jgi:hypothetical protein
VISQHAIRRIAMQTYPIPMVPGPVSVPPEVLKQYQVNYGSGDLESDYLKLYNRGEAFRISDSAFRAAKALGENDFLEVIE